MTGMILNAISLSFLLNHSVVRKGVVPLTSVALPTLASVALPRKGVVPLTSVALPDTHAFECGNTPKMLKRPREHGIASPSAFLSSLNDFPQLGGNQNQNSRHAIIFECNTSPVV